MEPNEIEYSDQRIATCNDYLISLKTGEQIVQPGDLINSKQNFKINNDDQTVFYLTQHKNRSKTNYATLLPDHDPSQVFKIRYQDHIKMCTLSF